MHSLSLRRHAHGLLAERLMHIAHKIGNTSGVSKLSSDWLNYTGFSGDVCVAFRLETKMPWCQTPSWKKKAIVFTTVTMSAYQDQVNAGFVKVCKIFKVRGTESLKYVQELYTTILWGHFHAPKQDATQNETWLVALPVSHVASWARHGHSKQPRFPDLLPSVWRSSYASQSCVVCVMCFPLVSLLG